LCFSRRCNRCEEGQKKGPWSDGEDRNRVPHGVLLGVSLRGFYVGDRINYSIPNKSISILSGCLFLFRKVTQPVEG
jgi:hypothetical protein